MVWQQCTFPSPSLSPPSPHSHLVPSCLPSASPFPVFPPHQASVKHHVSFQSRKDGSSREEDKPRWVGMWVDLVPQRLWWYFPVVALLLPFSGFHLHWGSGGVVCHRVRLSSWVQTSRLPSWAWWPVTPTSRSTSVFTTPTVAGMPRLASVCTLSRDEGEPEVGGVGLRGKGEGGLGMWLSCCLSNE